MSNYQLLLPKMGESVAEATIIKWLKNPGDYIEADEAVLEIATDKVDSEVPSPVAGKLVTQLYVVDDVVQVGSPIALIQTEDKAAVNGSPVQPAPQPAAVAQPAPQPAAVEQPQPEPVAVQQQPASQPVQQIPGIDQLQQRQPVQQAAAPKAAKGASQNGRFYSPLVKSIAAQEGIELAELDTIPGTGAEGRLTKDDLLNYIQHRHAPAAAPVPQPAPQPVEQPQPVTVQQQAVQTEQVRQPEPVVQQTQPQPQPATQPQTAPQQQTVPQYEAPKTVETPQPQPAVIQPQYTPEPAPQPKVAAQAAPPVQQQATQQPQQPYAQPQQYIPPQPQVYQQPPQYVVYPPQPMFVPPPVYAQPPAYPQQQPVYYGGAPIYQQPEYYQPEPVTKPAQSAVSVSGEDEIIEMDRMRKLIAEHMVNSKRTSPHVTSFIEVDVTNIVMWRDAIKNQFEAREKEKMTFTPIFIEAVARAIKELPMINVSVDGTNIIMRKNINVGMATALPTGNLIVPVIKKADELSLTGLAKAVNDLANRARKNKLKPEEIKDGTFTITNVGTFGNVMGTPIINQPQVAILAIGAIKKKPAVMETPTGDVITVRHMMFLSLSYDHRVVDGALGGSFIKKVADYLEGWDLNRPV